MKFERMRFWKWVGIWLFTTFMGGGVEAIARSLPYEPAHAHSGIHKGPKGSQAGGKTIPDDWVNRGNGGGKKHGGHNGKGTHNDDWNASGGSTSAGKGGKGGKGGSGTHSDDWSATEGGGSGKVRKGGHGSHGDNWTSTNAVHSPRGGKKGPAAPPSSERGPK